MKKELLETLGALETLFSTAAGMPGMTDRLFADWEAACDSIRRQLSEETIRVAVVGSIKSGKSTFVNAYVSGDYLKRGAGVVTSIVTKIRQGETLQAKLIFKSWDEINTDIRQALTLLPNFSAGDGGDGFDIRRPGERKRLADSLGALPPDRLVSNGAVDANSVLLTSYLKGYETVRQLPESDNVTRVYKDAQFAEHREFVANDHLSVYLKDIRLEIVSDALADYFEIADCQGSDSPNPHHLAMIQDYLNLTHLIIYVISSRTGLRQADIRFLSMIKQMGIMDNILFVVNCDFNEHESIEELQRLISKVKEELRYIKPDQTVFAFSALLNLFRIEKNRLSEKDRRRLEQWESETKLAAWSDSQSRDFGLLLNRRLNRERYALLLQNQLERMRLMATGTGHWVQVNQTVMSRNADQIEEIVKKIATYQRSLDQIKSMIQDTLGGAVSKLKAALRTDVDRLFEQQAEGILDMVLHFIQGYDIRVETFGPELEQMGFNNAMYRVFQEFRQAMDMFMADTVTPRILRFVRERETEVFTHLNGLVDSFGVMIEDSLAEFNRSLEQLGIEPIGTLMGASTPPDPENVKSIAGIQLPPASAVFRYSAKIKTEAVVRLGFYKVVKLMRQVLKKPVRSELERQRNALRDGGNRMKRETEKTIRTHLKDYRENLKFQYVFRLTDAVAEALKNALVDRFQQYADNLMKMVDGIRTRKLDRTRGAVLLTDMGRQAREIENGIRALQDRIKTLGAEAD